MRGAVTLAGNQSPPAFPLLGLQQGWIAGDTAHPAQKVIHALEWMKDHQELTRDDPLCDRLCSFLLFILTWPL